MRSDRCPHVGMPKYSKSSGSYFRRRRPFDGKRTNRIKRCRIRQTPSPRTIRSAGNLRDPKKQYGAGQTRIASLQRSGAGPIPASPLITGEGIVRNHFLDFLAALVPALLFAGSVFFGFVSGMFFFFVVSTIFGFNSPCMMDSGYIGWIGMTMK